MKEIPVIDPRRDVVFKTIFGKQTEKANIARNSLISAFLGKAVTKSTVLNPEMSISDVRDKATRLDVLCKLEDGSKVNLEMQMCATADSMEDRLAFYCSQLYIQQESQEKDYKDMKPVFVILISNSKINDVIKKYLSLIQLRLEDGTTFSNKLNIFILDLSKVEVPSKIGLDSDPVERWALFFTSAVEQERKKVLDSLIAVDEGIRMANDVLCEVTQDDYERAAIFEREKILRDYYAGLANATNKGKREGFDAGLARGRNEGLEQGLKQGKKLLQEEKIKTARSLKARNFSTEDILEITGLSEGEY
jgi:predicted transposase/invertase (TIGR01784 family)